MREGGTTKRSKKSTFIEQEKIAHAAARCNVGSGTSARRRKLTSVTVSLFDRSRLMVPSGQGTVVPAMN